MQSLGKFLADLPDISRAHGDDNVPCLTVGKEVLDDLVAIGKIMNIFVPVSGDLGGQSLGADAGDRLFAGGIDIEDDELIRFIKSGRKIVEEGGGAAVAMRLKDGNDPPLPALAGGIERCLDLRRVVPVVIDDHDAANFVLDLKAALHPAKIFKAGRDCRKAEAELHGGCGRGQGVEDIMVARHLEGDAAEALPAIVDGKGGSAGPDARLHWPENRLGPRNRTS